MTKIDETLRRLEEGNIRFAGGSSIHPNLTDERRIDTLRNGQTPFAGILSCSDSRSPVELIFDQGIGDIFSVRNAGNICDDFTMGSLELGVYKFNIPLLIVMGHTDCGAIRLAVQGNRLHANISRIIDRIIPVVTKVKENNPGLYGEGLMLEVTKANALSTAKELVENSKILRDKVRYSELRIIAAMHDLESGRVEWLE